MILLNFYVHPSALLLHFVCSNYFNLQGEHNFCINTFEFDSKIYPEVVLFFINFKKVTKNIQKSTIQISL